MLFNRPFAQMRLLMWNAKVRGEVAIVRARRDYIWLEIRMQFAMQNIMQVGNI